MISINEISKRVDTFLALTTTDPRKVQISYFFAQVCISIYSLAL